jgi:hypothetical protein
MGRASNREMDWGGSCRGVSSHCPTHCQRALSAVTASRLSETPFARIRTVRVLNDLLYIRELKFWWDQALVWLAGHDGRQVHDCGDRLPR